MLARRRKPVYDEPDEPAKPDELDPRRVREGAGLADHAPDGVLGDAVVQR